MKRTKKSASKAKGGRDQIFNTLTILMLVMTVCLIGFYGLIGLNIFNPFAPPPTLTIAVPPTPTETPTKGIPTWTPTPSPSVTPSPRPTNTRTPTLTPSPFPTIPPSPTPPPTATETPRVTRSYWQFTHEVRLIMPMYGCEWTGVAGHVQDLDGNPLKGYPVHIWGAGIDTVVNAGADQRFNTIYGSQAAFELFFDNKPKPMQVRLQLHDPYKPNHPAVSDEVVIDFPGFCGGALGYVVFTQNH